MLFRSLIMLLFFPANRLSAQIPGPELLEIGVAVGTDDAEEFRNGRVRLNGRHIKLGAGGHAGIRFDGVTIPPGAEIIEAFIVFTAPHRVVMPAVLNFAAEIGDAAAFSGQHHDISGRSLGRATVTWASMLRWHKRDKPHRSPDLSSIVQEIVYSDHWSQGGAMAFIVTGKGRRSVIAYDRDPASAPLLRVRFRRADISPPSVPANLTAADISPCRVSLVWDPSTDDTAVAGYDIFRDGVLTATTSETFRQDTDVAPKTEYSYSVTAFDAAGNRSEPSLLSVTTPADTSPPVLTILEPDGIDDTTDGTAVIRWTDEAPAGNAAISLWYDTDAFGGDGLPIMNGLVEDPDGTADTYNWHLSGLKNGDYYIYAVIDDGINPPVQAYSSGPFTLYRPEPPTLEFSAGSTAIPAGGSIDLSWSTHLADGLYIDNGIGPVAVAGTVKVYPEHTTTYTLTGAGPGGTVNARVTVMVLGNPQSQPEGFFGQGYEDLIPRDAVKPDYDPRRFAVITGLVKSPAGDPEEGVSVTVHGSPEYGTVLTNSEGRFSIPVEGGGSMAVVFQKPGLLTAQRQVDVPWNDIAVTDSVKIGRAHV